MIKCVRCNELKNESDFYLDKNKTNGFSSWCKKCHILKASTFNKNNRKYVNKKTSERASSNPKLYWCKCTLKGHKSNGFIVDLSCDDLYHIVKEKETCDICETPLHWERNETIKKVQQNSPSLDRKNNEHIINKDNIMIICRQCNTTKLNRSLSEFVEYCINVVKKFGDK